MTNEATLVLKTSEPIDWIIIDTEAVEKGTVMVISGSSTIGRTAMSGSTIGIPFAGVARREKIANDGRTRLSLFRESIFRLTSASLASGKTISAGDAVMLSGSNTIVPIKHDSLSGSALSIGLKVGTSLEDISSAGDGEVWVGR